MHNMYNVYVYIIVWGWTVILNDASKANISAVGSSVREVGGVSVDEMIFWRVGIIDLCYIYIFFFKKIAYI